MASLRLLGRLGKQENETIKHRIIVYNKTNSHYNQANVLYVLLAIYVGIYNRYLGNIYNVALISGVA